MTHFSCIANHEGPISQRRVPTVKKWRKQYNKQSVTKNSQMDLARTATCYGLQLTRMSCSYHRQDSLSTFPSHFSQWKTSFTINTSLGAFGRSTPPAIFYYVPMFSKFYLLFSHSDIATDYKTTISLLT